MLAGALLVLATLFLYVRVRHYNFLVFDDDGYITKNIHVTTGLNPSNIIWAFTSFHESNWHPITWLSHMVDCQWFGVNPGPQHLVNIALHAANVLLLFGLLRTATGAVWRSFFAAALFAFHPLNVETVAWVAERKSLLSMLFSLLTIAAYGWYAQRPCWTRYISVVVAFSLALMSKPMAVSLPLILLLVDYWPLERDKDLPLRTKWIRLSMEKLPLLLMSAASSFVTMAAQRSGGAVENIPFSMRMGNAIVCYVAYIAKTIWPSNLAAFYPYRAASLPCSKVVASAVVLLGITVIVLHFHRARYLVMGWCLFVLGLIPVIGIVQVGLQAMADRYAYVPCIGLFIIIAWGLNDLSEEFDISPVVPTLFALVLMSALVVATNRYLPYWQNGVELFTRAANVADHPDFAIEEALGDAFVSAGQDRAGYQHYGKACTLRPDNALCHYNMGGILLRRNQLQEALRQYQLAASLTDSRELVLSCLIFSGATLLELGDYQTAELKVATALQIDPHNDLALRLRQRLSNEKNSNNR